MFSEKSFFLSLFFALIFHQCSGFVVDLEQLYSECCKRDPDVFLLYSLEKLQQDLSELEPSIKGGTVFDLKGRVLRPLLAKLDYLVYKQGEETPMGRLCKGLQVALEKLKLSKYILNEESTCFICMDSLRCSVKPSCGHEFCKTCLMLWFAEDKVRYDSVYNQCPICRQPFNRKTRKILRSHPGYKCEFERCKQQRLLKRQQEEAEDELLAQDLAQGLVIGGDVDPEPVAIHSNIPDQLK